METLKLIKVTIHYKNPTLAAQSGLKSEALVPFEAVNHLSERDHSTYNVYLKEGYIKVHENIGISSISGIIKKTSIEVL